MDTMYQLADQANCATDTWCNRIYALTGNTQLAALAEWLIATPASIALILSLALITRFLSRRAISRLTRANSPDKAPSLLRPSKAHQRETIRAVAKPLSSERRAQRARTIGSMLKSFASIAIFSLAIILILGQLGINLAPIIASAGVIGVALGFGAQNVVKDFVAGVFMILEDQYGVGDIVDLGPASGTVEGVGLRITTVRDSNGTVWYIRNGEVSRVGNSSQEFGVAVVDLPLGCATDVQRAIEIAEKTAAEVTSKTPLDEDALEPPKVLGVEKITTDGVTLRLTTKVRPGRQWAVQRALRAHIKTAFDAAHIESPCLCSGTQLRLNGEDPKR